MFSPYERLRNQCPNGCRDIGGAVIGAVTGGGGGLVVGGLIGAGGGYVVGNEIEK